MDEKKLQRLAIKLNETIPAHATFQGVYDNLAYKARGAEKDYFKYLGPENFLKLAFYIWSYRETGLFQSAEEKLNKISFIHVLESSGDYTSVTCEECQGDGTSRCDECGGSGRVECGECGGTGDVDCSECNGEGQVEGDGEMIDCPECNGGGEETCSECDGDGEVSCHQCGGDGDSTCSLCDGDGETQSDTDMDYDVLTIVTWNKSIIDRAEYTEDQIEVLVTSQQQSKIEKAYLLLTKVTRSGELMDQVDYGDWYTMRVDDSPKLVFTDLMTVQWPIDKNEDAAFLV